MTKRYGELELENVRLKQQLADCQAKNMELKAQRQEDIDNPLSISPSGIYFDTRRIPFCAGCYDGQTGRRVHLVYKRANVGSVIYACPVCKTEYADKDDVSPMEPWQRASRRTSE